jgi:hypothetical protein
MDRAMKRGIDNDLSANAERLSDAHLSATTITLFERHRHSGAARGAPRAGITKTIFL